MNKFIDKLPESVNSNVSNLDNTTLDLFFQIQDKVYAKGEETSKSYNKNILVSFDEIQQLHRKTMQCVESLRPLKNSIKTHIVISHNEGESDKFHSF